MLCAGSAESFSFHAPLTRNLFNDSCFWGFCGKVFWTDWLFTLPHLYLGGDFYKIFHCFLYFSNLLNLIWIKESFGLSLCRLDPQGRWCPPFHNEGERERKNHYLGCVSHHVKLGITYFIGPWLMNWICIRFWERLLHFFFFFG